MRCRSRHLPPVVKLLAAQRVIPRRCVSVKILDVTPMLTVIAMETAIAFYRDILGFECMASTPNSLGLHEQQRRESLMLALPNAFIYLLKSRS